MTTSERAQQQQLKLSRDDNLQRLLLEEVQKSGFVTAAGYKAVLQKVLHTNAVAKNAVNAANETSSSVGASHPSRDVTMAMVGESHRRVSETSSSLSTHNNDRSKQQNNNNNRRRPTRSMIRDSMFGSMIKSNLSTMSVSSSLTASNFSNSLLSSSVTASNLSGSLSFSKRGSLGGGSHNVHTNNVRASSNLMTCTFEDFIEEQVVFPVPDHHEDVGTKNNKNVTASILLSANTNNLAPRRRRSDYSVTSIEQDVMATSSRARQQESTESSFTRRKNGSSREGRQGSCRRSRLIKLISVKFDDPQEKEEEDNKNTSQDDTPGTSRNNVDNNKVKQRRMKKKKQHKKKVVPTEVTTTTTTMNNSDSSFFMNSDTNLDCSSSKEEFDPQAFINNLVCSSRSDQKLTAKDINLKLKKSGSEKWLPWPSASKRNLFRGDSLLSKRSSMQSSFSSYDVEEEEEEEEEENNDNKSSSFLRTANDDGEEDVESGNSEEWLAWPEDQGSSSRSLLQEVASSIRARAA